MCVTCGCGDGETTIEGDAHPHAHTHDHPHTHSHAYVQVDAHTHGGLLHSHAHKPAARMVQVEQDILAKNNQYALANRQHFAGHGIFALNLVSSPGSGKTTLLCATIEALKARNNRVPLAVIEGDQQTSNDADRIRATGAPAIQINTGKGCHLDAQMVSAAFARLPLHNHQHDHQHDHHADAHASGENGGILFIENVGNLVCPALWDLGEAAKVVILSVTEGEDKPLKYPDMFAAARLMILNKTDLLPYLKFDVAQCIEYARRINPAIEVLQLSATSGQGMEAWLDWIDAGQGKRNPSPQAAPLDRLHNRIAELESELAALKAQAAGG
ncbi:MAG: hydrogenase nickel incorporation protein HypB [Burkholderiaceae bacterium]|nr:hydrogenase nickel incorporation protein HypB [Burkholderiaceae bacterium]